VWIEKSVVDRPQCREYLENLLFKYVAYILVHFGRAEVAHSTSAVTVTWELSISSIARIFFKFRK